MDLIVKEYLGSNIEFKMINGSVYANATSMARAFDNGSQKLKDWKRSQKTNELIDELNKINEVGKSHNDLIIAEKGGIDGGGRSYNVSERFENWKEGKLCSLEDLIALRKVKCIQKNVK